MLKYSAIVNLSVSALKCYGLGSSLQRLKCVPVVYSLTKRNYIVKERNLSVRTIEVLAC